MSNSDFSDLAISATVRWSLSNLKRKEIIRPLVSGIYDYPRYNDFLGERLAPDMEMVAHAFGRKFQWSIQISGNTALSYLGLTTQIPARFIYFSDGPSKEYDILGRTLQFKHTRLRESKLQLEKSELLVQALKELGPGEFTASQVQKIRSHLNEKERKSILRDTRYVPDWIQRKILTICREQIDG